MNSICKTGKYTDYQKRSMGVRRRRTTDCSPIPASYAFERHRDHLEQLALVNKINTDCLQVSQDLHS